MTKLRPMTEAPRDGTPVLVWTKSGHDDAVDWHDHSGCWRDRFGGRVLNIDLSGFIAPLPPDTSPTSLLRFARDVAAVLDDEGRAALVCSLLSDGVVEALLVRANVDEDTVWGDSDRRIVVGQLHALRETTDEG